MAHEEATEESVRPKRRVAALKTRDQFVRREALRPSARPEAALVRAANASLAGRVLLPKVICRLQAKLWA